jgi:dephospho-CoA kinase
MAQLPHIAITGGLRSGKDTVGAYLREKYGYTRFAFGNGIREVTFRLYPHLYANGEKPRALLQGFGQMARSFDEDVWVRDLFRRIDGHERLSRADAQFYGHNYEPVRVVVTDLRQPNELARCRAEGYVIIRVKATSALRIQRAVEASDTFRYEDLAHETEQHTDGFAVDYEIENDGSLDELYAQIDAIMAAINT